MCAYRIKIDANIKIIPTVPYLLSIRQPASHIPFVYYYALNCESFHCKLGKCFDHALRSNTARISTCSFRSGKKSKPRAATIFHFPESTKFLNKTQLVNDEQIDKEYIIAMISVITQYVELPYILFCRLQSTANINQSRCIYFAKNNKK